MAHGRVFHISIINKSFITIVYNSIINKSQSLSEEPIQTTKTN